MKLPLFAALALSLAACGGGSGVDTSAEGIYTVSAWNGTENGCEGAGTPLDPPSSTARLYIESVSVFGTSFLNVVPCDDEAECQEGAESSTVNLSFIGWTFDKGSDSAGWTGSGGDSVSGDDTTCLGNSNAATMTINGSSVHIENRRTKVEWPKPSGGCTLDDLPMHAATAACTSKVVVDATFAKDI